jgi:hypothetical protein
MKLALRSTPSDEGSLLHRIGAALVRWRLCSQWCHGGIVIGGVLYQSNAKHGLHSTPDWEPHKWLLIELGGRREQQVLAGFDWRKGAPYDWLGVLGFALPFKGKRRALYCFEWCALAIGAPFAKWQTPEKLLAHVVCERETHP